MAKKKKKKKRSFVKTIFSWTLFLISIYFILSVMFLNLLDIIQLLIVVVAVFLIDFILVFLMKKIKILGLLFVFCFGSLLLYFSFNIHKTVGFLNNLNLNYKTYHYCVVVLKKSDKKKLSDIRNLSLGYYDDGGSEAEKALDKVRNKQETEVFPYEDTHQLANDLIQGKVEAVLLEDTYLDILDESIEDNGKKFKSLVRIIYDFVIITKTSDISRDTDVTQKPFNVYISGIDTYGEISNVSRSDVNMIVSVNPSTRQVLITSIPRDYYVSLHGKSGYKDKLTHAGLYGVDMSIHTLEDLLDIKINYYVKVNFSSVVKIVNALDGVNVYSEYDFTSIDGIHYQSGYNQLNGEEALSFARERKSFPSGDRQRIKNQQALFSAILDKVVSKNMITKYSRLLDSVNGSFVTNIKMSRLTSLARLQLSKKYKWNVSVNSLEGEDGRNYTYSAPSVQAYVMVPISSSVEDAHQLIQDVFGGEVVNQSIDTSVRKSSNSGNNSNNSNKNQETNDKDKVESSYDDNKKSGLEARLVKENVSFVEGDTYIYHGYQATYGERVITTSNGLQEKFQINNKTFDRYQDLVSYVSGLSAGDYVITYVIQYQQEIVNLKQYVKIEELKVDSSNEKKEDEDDSSNKQEDEDDSSNKQEKEEENSLKED